MITAPSLAGLLLSFKGEEGIGEDWSGEDGKGRERKGSTGGDRVKAGAPVVDRRGWERSGADRMGGERNGRGAQAHNNKRKGNDMNFYPLDPEKLKKGMTIHEETIAEIYGIEADDDRYKIHAQLKLRDWIHQITAKLMNPMICKCVGNDLYIMTDPEALKYQTRDRELRKRGIVRMSKRTASIDRRNLSETQQQDHDREMRTQANMAFALKQIEQGKLLAPVDHKKTTPRLLEENK